MTMREIAERCGVSLRTARRRMDGVEVWKVVKAGPNWVAEYRVQDAAKAFRKG